LQRLVFFGTGRAKSGVSSGMSLPSPRVYKIGYRPVFGMMQHDLISHLSKLQKFKRVWGKIARFGSQSCNFFQVTDVGESPSPQVFKVLCSQSQILHDFAAAWANTSGAQLG